MVPSLPASIGHGLELGNHSRIAEPEPKHTARYGCDRGAGFCLATNLGRAAPAHGSQQHPVRSRGSAASVAQSGFLCRAGGVLRRDSTPAAGPARKAQCARYSAHGSFDIVSRPSPGLRWLSYPPSQRYASRLPAGARCSCQPAHHRDRGGSVSADRRHSWAPTCATG